MNRRELWLGVATFTMISLIVLGSRAGFFFPTLADASFLFFPARGLYEPVADVPIKAPGDEVLLGFTPRFGGLHCFSVYLRPAPDFDFMNSETYPRFHAVLSVQIEDEGRVILARTELPAENTFWNSGSSHISFGSFRIPSDLPKRQLTARIQLRGDTADLFARFAPLSVGFAHDAIDK